MSNRVNVVIIDSGLMVERINFDGDVSGICIKLDSKNQISYSNDFSDNVGHGTAVVDCFLKHNACINSIFCIKIYNGEEIETDSQILNAAIDYIDNNIICDMVVISSGIVFTDTLDELESNIKRLTDKGVIIVSAFDNDGVMSFPAGFESVIGVATNALTNESPRVCDSSLVNVVIQEKTYRLSWVDPPKVMVGGSSFATPIVAANLMKILSNKNYINFRREELLKELSIIMNIPFVEEDSNKKIDYKEGILFVKKIKKAIVFPWNKEMHSLARYIEMLPFNIVGFYDTKYNMNIGRDIGKLLNIDSNLGKIQNIDSMDWNDDFDTIICGHCLSLSHATNRNWLKELSIKCREFGKQMYAFDKEALQYYEHNDSKIFIPSIKKDNRLNLQGGRLYERAVPVIGIFGTSSRQGKFTVQLELRRRFLKNGYKIGQITSEPSGYLFGADAVYPYGYNANVEVSIIETTMISNNILHNLITDRTDAVIVGGQSGSVPFCYNNLSQMNFYNQGFLYGTNPDVFVLCVNPHDSIEYIKNTISSCM